MLDRRIGTLELKERSRWARHWHRDEAGMAVYDLCSQQGAITGLLDAMPMHEGLLESISKHVQHTCHEQPKAVFLLIWSTITTAERHP